MDANVQASKDLLIKIEGMKCFYCFTVVADILNEFDGIKKVRLGLNKGNVIVTYNKEKIDSDKLVNTLQAAGYNPILERR